MKYPPLTETHPLLASQWHPTRNLSPLEKISQGSGRKVWWLCDECTHEWEATVEQRVKRGTGCPACARRNRYRKPLEDSFQIAHPYLIEIWHPTKNVVLKPEYLSQTDKRKVWWSGECGHEWEQSVKYMVERTSTCPYCSGVKVLPGFNDFATIYPHLASEWHPTKNEKPIYGLSPHSHYKAWWRCEKGHEWQTAIQNRTRKNTKCPYCAKRRVLPNEVVEKHPKLLEELQVQDPVYIANLSYTSKVEWVCSAGHTWEAVVNSRVNGAGCPICSNVKILTGFNDLVTTHPELALQWDTEANSKTPQQVSYGSGYKAYWKCDKGHSWQAKVSDRTCNRSGCPACAGQSYASRAEKDIENFIFTVLKQSTVKNDRATLKRKEIDIYIPELRIGVEFNGTYWHSELAGKHHTYHYDKWKSCQDKSIQLIQIWEDDWNRNPELVKRMLAHKLGVSQERKVFARKTQIAPIAKERAEKFLIKNHIQGYSSGSYYLGLTDNQKDELVAVLVLKKEPGTNGKTLNIIRYATSCNVVGGFTKLLKHAERSYSPEKFITFSDHCISDGGLYEKNGFVADKELPPDYMYVVKGQRKHKFGYRLKRFRDDPNLTWQEGLSERELAALNSIPRIWDAGKTRWVKHLV